jgi:hypothetical protein
MSQWLLLPGYPKTKVTVETHTLEVPLNNVQYHHHYLPQRCHPIQYLPTIAGARIIFHGNPNVDLENHHEILGTLVIRDILHCGKIHRITSGITGNFTATKKIKHDICVIGSLNENVLICITLRMNVNGNEIAS